MPVELGFEYGNGYTLKQLSEIEGSHVLDSCDDQGVYATADHSSMPGYSGKYGYPGSFTSVGSYYFQIKTRVESDWYDIVVEKTPGGQPTEGVSLAEGKSLYIDFLANLTTFDDDPTVSFQQTLQAKNALKAVRVVARPGCLVSIDRNFYLYRHELLDDWDDPIATNWCVVAADRSGATPVRRMWELTHVDGSAFPANEDGFDRITIQATRPAGAESLVYSVFINGQPTAAGGVTAFSSLNAGRVAPTAVSIVGFSGRAKVDDFVITETPPSFVEGTRVEKGRFKVLPGYLPHVAYDQCPDVDFAVDKYGKDGWEVCFHGSYAHGCVVPGVGSIVGSALFVGASCEATGTGETFTFAFHYDSKLVPNPKYPEYWGWVTLGTDARGDLVVLDSAVCEQPDVLVAGVDVASGSGEVIEARPHISLWKAENQGGWMELASGCIPRETEGLVVIPRAIDGLPVRVIGKGAFAGCTGITSVRIPESVREIGKGAFEDCRAIQSVSLPSGLEKIGDYAFVGCACLTSLTLPAGIGQVDWRAFPQGNPLVVHVPSPEAGRIVRLMVCDPESPGKTFDPRVTFAVDPTDEERVAGKFEWRFHVVEGEAVLGGEDDRTAAAVPTSVSGALEIPSELAGLAVSGIGPYAFDGCGAVTSVKIPGSVRQIGYRAFSGCFNVQSVEVPVGVAEFSMPLFCDSPDIVSATIPGCDRKIWDFVQSPDRLRVLSVAEGSVFVGEGQFSACCRIQTVTLPATLRSIGRCAFQGCDELRQVSLPEELLEVGGDAFCGCKGIKALHVPGSVAVVDDWAFRGMYELKALSFGEGVRIIGEGAFSQCPSLERVAFPSTLQLIDRDAFEASNGIRELVLPEGLMMVDEGAFRCKDVTTVTVPSTLLYVGYRAFDFGSETAVRVAKGDVSRVSRLFEDADIEFEVGQIVEEGQLTKSEKTVLANRLVAETITTEFMQDFAALSPGETVTVTIPGAQPGLTYALGVSATLDGLSAAVRDAPKAEATAEGVTLTVVKPAGGSAFFTMAVGEP